MGVDIGSTASKCVILKNGETVISEAIVNLGAGTKGTDRVIQAALDKVCLTLDDINNIVSTGYGRNSYEKAKKTMSELSCHAKGGKIGRASCRERVSSPV